MTKVNEKEPNIQLGEQITKLSVTEVYDLLQTSPQGLTFAQAQEYQKIQGKNVIDEKKKKSFYSYY